MMVIFLDGQHVRPPKTGKASSSNYNYWALMRLKNKIFRLTLLLGFNNCGVMKQRGKKKKSLKLPVWLDKKAIKTCKPLMETISASTVRFYGNMQNHIAVAPFMGSLMLFRFL